jgi:hypothetical protein
MWRVEDYSIVLLVDNSTRQKNFSRKGAKAQSTAVFLKGFSLRLCAFAGEMFR